MRLSFLRAAKEEEIEYFHFGAGWTESREGSTGGAPGSTRCWYGKSWSGWKCGQRWTTKVLNNANDSETSTRGGDAWSKAALLAAFSRVSNCVVRQHTSSRKLPSLKVPTDRKPQVSQLPCVVFYCDFSLSLFISVRDPPFPPHFWTSWLVFLPEHASTPYFLLSSVLFISTVFPFPSEMTNINPQITSQHTLIRPAVGAQCSTFQIQDKQAMFCCTFRWLTQMCSRCRFYTRYIYEMVSLAFPRHTFADFITLNRERSSYFYLNWN